jgi:hypothetical protein
MNTFIGQPLDIQKLILTYIDPYDVIEFRSVSKQFNTIIRYMKLKFYIKTPKEAYKCVEIIKRAELILPRSFNFTLNDLKMLSKNIVGLECNYDKRVSNDDFKYLPKLRHLILWDNETITNDGLQKLMLTYLDIMENDKITDDGIHHLTTLTELSIRHNSSITDNGIKHLVNLKSLVLNDHITDNGLTHLVNMEELYNLNENITDNGLKPLVKLK